jgi:two-component system chemotaxis response regulator CheB
MNKIRILAVDDSVVIRRMICEAFAADPSIEVAGTAGNGRLALAKIEQLKPDLVTLDVEMPEMNGLEAVAAIREKWPQLPVIMFSTLTERGADTTLEALRLGATDYVTKPINFSGGRINFDRVRDELAPKILALCPGVETRAATQALRLAIPLVAHRTRPAMPARVVAIGVSTGGPNALNVLIPQLPKGFPVPVVITQHMPPMFTRHLAEQLSKRSALRVREGIPGQLLEPGEVWIAPGGFHMTVRRASGMPQLQTNQDPPENSCRPAVDVMFRSVAQAYGAECLGVVLTGMGSDGTRGSESIRAVGGQVIAQDESTSVVWGMPGSVVRAGLADRVLPLDSVSEEICKRVGLKGPFDRIPRQMQTA